MTCPPVPAFYQRPRSLDDVVDHTCVRVLDLFGLADSAAAASTLTVRRWPGLAPASHA